MNFLMDVAIASGAVIAVAVLYYLFTAPMSTTKVAIGNATVKAEIADTMPKQIRGLMFRKSLPANNGMLFTFGSDDYYGIWMMNMSIPIDIIWMDANHTVVYIVKDAQPCRIICPVYKPSELSRYVLEVNAGFTDKHGIEIGDVAKFKV